MSSSDQEFIIREIIKRMELSEEKLLIELGREQGASMLGMLPLPDKEYLEKGRIWLEEKRKIICTKLWENKKMSSYMQGKEVFDRASAGSIIFDILVQPFGVPMSLTTAAILLKQGLYETCKTYEKTTTS